MTAYTVSQIDELRRACERKYLYGTTKPRPSSDALSRSYNEGDMTKTVEERVRTYMLAGIYAQDIYESDKGNG